MFNDIDKKLKFSWIVNLIIGVIFPVFSAKNMLLRTPEGKEAPIISQTTLSTIWYCIMAAAIIISFLSLWISIALKKDKRGPFKWLSPLGKTFRILAWILFIGGLMAAYLFIFWCFLNVYSDNKVVNAISYAIIAIVPVSLMVICNAFFLYGLGNAADGGDATYVQNSKLFDMEPLHNDEDTRKICPNCGTRTDKHSCPNCGVKVY